MSIPFLRRASASAAPRFRHSAQGLRSQTGIAAKSNAAAAELDEPYRRTASYVAGDKLYSAHEAESAETAR